MYYHVFSGRESCATRHAARRRQASVRVVQRAPAPLASRAPAHAAGSALAVARPGCPNVRPLLGRLPVLLCMSSQVIQVHVESESFTQ